MYREINLKRARQALPEAECLRILEEGTYGVLALCGGDGMPYSVPVNYVLHGGKLYFHGSPRGHKADLIRENPNISLAVVARSDVHEEDYATYFVSVIAFGKARFVEDSEKLAIINWFCDRHAPGRPEERAAEIGKDLSYVGIAEINIEHMTGKMAKALVG